MGRFSSMNCNLSATRAITPFPNNFSRPARRALLLFCALAMGASAPRTVSAHDLSHDPAVNNGAAVAELICAIKSANASGIPSTINLVSNGDYTLTKTDNWEYGPNGLPQISGNLTINGQGATIQRASNSPDFRFFYVSGGLSSKYHTGLPAGTLALMNLTLTGGAARGGNGVGQGGGGAGMGGAIFNQGTLTLTAVTITGSTALGGNCITNGLAGGGGGMGQDGICSQGGGFGGTFAGVGGHGGNSAAGGGGGGGGFRPVDNGSSASATNAGTGGGLGMLAHTGDGGNGGFLGVSSGGANGGGYGCGGSGVGGSGKQSGGGGGIGGGGGHGGFSGADGHGGFGGGGGGGGESGGFGGFGGGGGSGNGGSAAGFAAGNGNPQDQGGGGGGGLGGAIFNHRGSLVLVNCTLTGNAAQGGDGFDAQGFSIFFGSGVGGSGYGGAIFNLNGAVSLNSSTIISNYVIPGATTTFTFDSQDNPVLTDVPTGGANGGALYNLAYGNKIEDGSASIATVCLDNSLLAGSIGGTGDLANNEIDGSQTNTATVTYCTNNLVMTSANLHTAICNGAPAGAVCALPYPGSYPAVAISLVANHPVLFWPTNFDGCTLQSTAAFPAAPGSWTSMSCTPGVVAGQYVIPDTAACGNKFYRLALPQ